MIAIVIPNLHSPLIDQVVCALERQTARAQIGEIIVVGQDRYGRVPAFAHFVATPRPISAPAARNLGAGLVHDDYLLFLDADCIAAPDLVERLLEAHRRGHAVVSGGVAVERENYWVLCDNLLVFAPYLAGGRGGPRPYLTSMCLSVERRVFEQVGGFDDRWVPDSEDVDLSMRLRAQGYGLHFEPTARVAHRPPRGSARALWEHQRTFGRGYVRLQRQYQAQLRSPLAHLDRRSAGLLLAAAPLLAARDMARLFAGNSGVRRYPGALGGMLWGRVGWYWGVVEGLMIRPARSV